LALVAGLGQEQAAAAHRFRALVDIFLAIRAGWRRGDLCGRYVDPWTVSAFTFLANQNPFAERRATT
jgi:hypothetical protein